MNINVYVFRRPNMFKVHDNFYNMIGYNTLKSLYTKEDFKSTGDLVLYYPERFLNIIEQRDLVNRVEKSGISNLTVVTSSVYILQAVNSKNIKVFDDETIEEGSAFKLSHDYSGLPNDIGLNVI